ncbi:MAG: DUF1553 domain-containing protein, partial [Verrucomicrobia bacterium]|nr:DUF1553 domain-containing protein [Verrucomicrobiota bacterium]
GETADYPVPVAWRYRNYVIEAFNADKPYDEFVREQVAGDLLAREGPRERYAERVTATGFLAISRRFGFDSENYHHLTIQDTIDGVGQTVLGLTLGCARCHDHKYDPVPLSDYYALYGIFESTRYAFPGSEQKQQRRTLAPLLPPEEASARWQAHEQRLAALTTLLNQPGASVPDAVLRPLDALDGDFEMQAPAAGGSKGVLVPPWRCEGGISIQAAAQSPFRNLHPFGRVGAEVAGGTNGYWMGQSLHLAGLHAAGSRVYANLDCRVATSEAAATGRHVLRLGSAAGPRAVEVLIGRDALAVRTGSVVEILRAVPAGQWFNVQLELDLAAGTVSGSAGAPGDVSSFAPRRLSPDWNGLLDSVVVASEAGAGALLPALSLDNLGVQTLPITAVSGEVHRGGAEAQRRNGDWDAGEDARPSTNTLAAARRELETLLANGPFPMAYAVSEGTPHDARVQIRGEPDRPGPEVRRGLLTALGGGAFPETLRGSGRRELAEWLASAENPLTARVMVNRIWLHHFGTGLVRTPNDFGVRGQPPEHPALLDHLASELVRSGWSVKAMHRLILGSAAYRAAGSPILMPPPSGEAALCPADPASASASAPGAPAAVREPGVQAVGPLFPRRRLSAEELRDSILWVSGELDESPGQGHPFPAPTTWRYTQHGPFNAQYEHQKRSVYLMTQRIRRHPFLALFDGADPNASTPERRLTTVPTQALFFLNDPFVHAQAGRLASQVLAADATPAAQVRSVYRRVLSRNPCQEEVGSALRFLTGYREAQEETGGDDVGARPLGALVRVLLGSNEFLTVD